MQVPCPRYVLCFLHTVAIASCCLQNSNLVLTAETRTREAAEPSGEPETLWGRMPGKMGDRVQFNKPEGLSEKKAKQKKKCALPLPSTKCMDNPRGRHISSLGYLAQSCNALNSRLVVKQWRL
jgi:hypothetical protein